MDRREELRQKLRSKINEKRQKQPSKQEIQRIKKDIAKEYNEVMKDDRIKPEMISLYTDAMRAFPKANMPNPKVILDDAEHYKKEYGKYVLNIMTQAKTNGWGVEKIKDMLNNTYTRYMTNVLDLPSLPSFVK